MADPTITGSFGSEAFQFTLNGVSTQKQMERLIQLTEAMARRIKADPDNSKKLNDRDKEAIKNGKELTAQEKEQIKRNEETEKAWEKLIGTSTELRNNWQRSIRDLGGWQSAVTGLTGFLIGGLTGYADSLSGALKMGVSGQIMDFAVASKTAGVSMTTFTKALSETGGGFASLGNSATNGAKNFASLVSSVRAATAGVGNLGMTLDENAMFTAQLTKVAISQGFKGRAAQDSVIKNSQALGKELDDLANRTGKNVLEMAAAAAKLASDPIVATFVKSAQAGSQKVSESINSLTAGLTAQFGAKGSKIAEDLVKSSLGGLPFAVTQTGKNMILSSQATYNELERQAAAAKRGDKITEEDRRRLNDIVKQEVAARGDQLRTMAQFEGPAGESARQILEMATEAETYNDEASRKRREEDKAAQQFNASIRQFQANLQALAIPFLNLINGINWTLFIDVIGGAIKVLEILLTPLTLLGKLIGDTGAGTVIGGLGALALIFFQGKAAFGFLIENVKKFSSLISTITTNLGLSSKLAPGPGLKPGDAGPEKPGFLKTAEEKIRERDARIQSERSTGEKFEIGMKRISPMVEKFAGAITGATAALAGSALAMWGEARLREDENDWLGEVLVKGGKTLEFLGVFGGLMLQYAPTVAALYASTVKAVAGMWAQVVANGGVVASLGILATQAKLAALDLFKFGKGGLLQVFGSFSRGLSTAVGVLTTAAPWLLKGFTLLRTGLTLLTGPIGWLIGGATALYFLWDDIADITKKLLDGFANFVTWIADGILGGLGAVWDGIKQVGDWISSGAKALWNAIKGPFDMFGDWLKNSWLGKMFGGGDGKKTAGDDKSTVAGMKNPDGSPMTQGQMKSAMDRVAPIAGGKSDPNKYYNNLSPDQRRATDDAIVAQAKFAATQTGEPKSGYSKELVNTQTNAIDQNRLKESESVGLQRKQLSLLEDINNTNSAQLGVQSRTAGNQDNSTRYLKTISMNGPAA